eukprot:tig00000449_g937.t1
MCGLGAGGRATPPPGALNARGRRRDAADAVRRRQARGRAAPPPGALNARGRRRDAADAVCRRQARGRAAPPPGALNARDDAATPPTPSADAKRVRGRAAPPPGALNARGRRRDAADAVRRRQARGRAAPPPGALNARDDAATPPTPSADAKRGEGTARRYDAVLEDAA